MIPPERLTLFWKAADTNCEQKFSIMTVIIHNPAAIYAAAMKIISIIFAAEFDIHLRRCFAFDETDTSLTLVDDKGCSVERLISDFTYDKSTGSAEATLYSMFRLPHSNRTYFQCDVAICRGSCPRPSCDNVDEQLKLQVEGQLSTTEEQGAGEDPFEQPEDDAVTTSTSVFVAQPGSAASGEIC
jgi:hypothetical protein